MDVFAGAWASFDNIPLETTNGSEHPQNHTFEMQNAEWNGFLKSLEQENPTSGADLGFHDFVATSHGPSDPTVTMSGLPLGMPFSASSSSTSSTITPPDSATQPGLTWAASNPSGFNYSGFNHSSAVQPFQPWRPVQIYTQGHVNNLDREGLLIQVPPTPHSAGGYQCGNVDRTVVEDVPRGHLNAIMQSSDNLSHCSDHRSETFMDEIAGHDGDDESESPDPCYAQLLYRCLREAPDNTMSLKELYDWIQQHSQKAKDPKSRGWQNSVRHNLSMNAVSVHSHILMSKLFSDFSRLSRKRHRAQVEVQRRAAFGVFQRRLLGRASYLPPGTAKTPSGDMIGKATQPHQTDNNLVQEVARQPGQPPGAIERRITQCLHRALHQSISTSAIKVDNSSTVVAHSSSIRQRTHRCHICYRHQDPRARSSSAMSVVSLSRS